jgi:hypothetical protein
VKAVQRDGGEAFIRAFIHQVIIGAQMPAKGRPERQER